MTRKLVALVATMLTSVILTAVPASAATATQNIPLAFSGDESIEDLIPDFTGVCDLCIPDLFVDVEGVSDEWIGLGVSFGADLALSFTSSATDAVTYNDTLLHQGDVVDVSHELTTGPGTLDLKLKTQGDIGVFYNESHAVDGWLPTSATEDIGGTYSLATIPCTMPLPGESPRICSSGPQATVDILTLPIGLGVGVALKVTFTFEIELDGSGIATVRKASVLGGQALSDNPITFEPTSPDTVLDPLSISCAQPVGNDLSLSLTDTSYEADPTVTLNVGLAIGITLDLLPDPDPWNIGELFDGSTGMPALQLSAPDQSIALGAIEADNKPPVADAGGIGPNSTYSGTEGTAVVFDGTGSSDNCGFPALRWDFSDGGVAFGPAPSHTFADNGHFTGQVTATDATGNTAIDTFEVNVSNADPAATAGPDTTADWGRDVSFTGQAVDPGSNDQSTLSYVWDFGDGTPPSPASAGQSVTHQYATPDTYTATLTVTDKNGGEDTDTRDVEVTKRAVTASYLGATAATYDTAATLRASLVDEYGQNVSGRSVAFEVDDVAKGSSNTGSDGVASVAYTPNEDAGGYATEAAFAGDSKYEAASSAGNVVVATKATTLTYTGALSGGPKKTVTLSAKLLDATGKPLGGRTVSFQLGTQSTSATTNATTGIATVALKLSQKNGSYPLISTYAPAGGDIGKYLGSSSSSTFKLQTK